MGKKKKLVLTPITEISTRRVWAILASYDHLVILLGQPTEIDNSDGGNGIHWGRMDQAGRKIFVSCSTLQLAAYWSTDGNRELVYELFGDNVIEQTILKCTKCGCIDLVKTTMSAVVESEVAA